jgi:hypothetical protein
MEIQFHKRIIANWRGNETGRCPEPRKQVLINMQGKMSADGMPLSAARNTSNGFII